jgi:sialate O-acetylesterase
VTRSLRLFPYFSDHAVLQRGSPIRVFGWAETHASVTVSLGEKNASAVTDATGRWEAIFPELPAGGPLEIKATDGTHTQSASDVLVGDVWLCSGQSNMEWPLAQTDGAEAEIANAIHPKIREFKIPQATSDHPEESLKGHWAACEPATAGKFSAVAYYFARFVREEIDVPIGVINSSFGGSPIEAWLPPEAFAGDDQHQEKLERASALTQSLLEADRKLAEAGLLDSAGILKDPGNRGVEQGWAAAGFDDSNWQEMHLPAVWENEGLLIDGSVWFRKSVKIPDSWIGRSLSISLGAADDFDVVYCNGAAIGSTGPETPQAYLVQRTYCIPAVLVTSDTLSIAVRVFDQFGGGGFLGPAEAMTLRGPLHGEDPAIALAGPWKYQVEWAVDRSSQLAQRHHWPSTLHNAMIHPVEGMPLTGMLWYQGETNLSRAANYAKLFPRLIQSWRARWNDASIPFYFVQLAGHTGTGEMPRDHEWAELRESQNAALQLENTGVAIALDVGDPIDIHPRNKREVGRRLSLLALARNYNRGNVDSGPFYEQHIFENGACRLKLRETADGLRTTDGGPVKGFAIAGADRKFVWADATITAPDELLVKSAAIPQPEAVRYAWDGNPICNLENSAGLPASPFRTDRWPLITAGRTWPD